jgi:hypothetical protein
MSTDLTTTGREGGTHPAHVGHLVMGLAFLGIVAIWATIQSGTVATGNVRWLLPLPFVFAGAAGLLAAVFSGRRSSRQPAYAGVTYPPPAPAYEPASSDEVGADEVGADEVSADDGALDGGDPPAEEPTDDHSGPEEQR